MGSLVLCVRLLRVGHLGTTARWPHNARRGRHRNCPVQQSGGQPTIRSDVERLGLGGEGCGHAEREASLALALVLAASILPGNPHRVGRCGSAVRGRDGRVAEGARLESVYTGNRIVGSNPTPSAKINDFASTAARTFLDSRGL